MVTIRDIAQRLGIAVSTVSKGLNGAPDVSAETRQLVLDTAVEMGYAAKRARRQAQPKVCVLVENMEYDVIYADPCMKRMTPEFAGIFVDTIHFAVSGHLAEMR